MTTNVFGFFRRPYKLIWFRRSHKRFFFGAQKMGLELMLGVVLLVLPYAATSRPTAAEVMDGVQVHQRLQLPVNSVAIAYNYPTPSSPSVGHSRGKAGGCFSRRPDACIAIVVMVGTRGHRI